MEIITGYRDTAHVTAEQEGACQAGVYGTSKAVLPIGNRFAHEVLSNNTIRIKDGYAINQGRLFGTAYGDYDDVTINNGTQGKKRRDVIAIRYTMNESSGIEDGSLEVIQGTPGTDYVTPTISNGDITSGASEDDMPLYYVNINGLTIESVSAVFAVKQSMEDLGSAVTSLNSSLANLEGHYVSCSNVLDYIKNDLDGYSKYYVFRCPQALGSPYNDAGDVDFWYEVFSSDQIYSWKIVIAYNQRGTEVFINRLAGGIWQGWQKLATGDDLEKKGLQYSYQDGIVNCTATDLVGIIEEALNKIDCKSGTSSILVKSGDNIYRWLNVCLDWAGYGFASLSNHAGAGLEYICGIYPNNNVLKVSGNIKRLATSSDIQKYAYRDVVAENIAPGTYVQVPLSMPENANTILAIIPSGLWAANSWETIFSLRMIDFSNRTAHIGSAAQSTITDNCHFHYIVVYN